MALHLKYAGFNHVNGLYANANSLVAMIFGTRIEIATASLPF